MTEAYPWVLVDTRTEAIVERFVTQQAAQRHLHMLAVYRPVEAEDYDRRRVDNGQDA